jgi:hypothetical protein
LVPCLPGASLVSCAYRRRVSVAGEGSPPPSTTELQRWFKGQFFYGLRSVPMAFSVSAGCYSPPSSPASPAASAPMWSISGLVLFSFGVCGRMLDLLGVVVLGTRRQCSSKFKGSVSIVRRYASFEPGRGGRVPSSAMDRMRLQLGSEVLSKSCHSCWLPLEFLQLRSADRGRGP